MSLGKFLALDIVERLAWEDIACVEAFEQDIGECSEAHRFLAVRTVGLYGWVLAQEAWAQEQRRVNRIISTRGDESFVYMRGEDGLMHEYRESA